MSSFIRIKNSFFHEDHVVAVKKIRSFRDDHGKIITHVVRISEEAAGDENPRHRNIWCTAEDVEDFLLKSNMPSNAPTRRAIPEDPKNLEPCPIQDTFSAS